MMLEHLHRGYCKVQYYRVANLVFLTNNKLEHFAHQFYGLAYLTIRHLHSYSIPMGNEFHHQCFPTSTIPANSILAVYLLLLSTA